MIEQDTAIRIYLSASRDSFWQWRDGGDVAVWRDGPTIAFREELADIIGYLAPMRLPHLGAIMLLVAATRDNWRELPDVTGELVDVLKHSDAAWAHVDLLYEVLQGLDKVNELAPDLRNSVSAKATLAEVVFEDVPHNLLQADGQPVADLLRHRLEESIVSQDESVVWWNDAPQMLLLALRALAHGLARATPERLQLRRKTGLDRLPLSADEPLPVAARVRTMLSTLKDDEELGGLAQLASRLMAAVSLPQPLRDRDELPIGGVSDIINRGSLDKLLISELAYDDLTLAARVAMNEALYLRRESPPRNPPRHRMILLETGLRSWGVPRVFATAVALSLAATADRDGEVSVFRARRDRIAGVDLTTRDGLAAHLAALDTELHPGAALEAFFRAADDVQEADAEPILIASDEVLADHEFQQRLSETTNGTIYVVSVNRTGELTIHERTLRGSKPLKNARLDLECLFAEPAPSEPQLIKREWARDLPMIFSVEPFPLLLSHNIDPAKAWPVKDCGTLSITNDRRLMYWDERGKGARQINDDVRVGKVQWFSPAPIGGRACAIIGSDGGVLNLLQCDLEAGVCDTHELSLERKPYTFCNHREIVFAMSGQQAIAINTLSHEVLETLTIPARCKHIQGRFYHSQGDGRWYALAYDGHAVRLETVLDVVSGKCPELISMFDSDVVEGPIGITRSADLYHTATEALQSFPHGLRGDVLVQGISPRGDRVRIYFVVKGVAEQVELDIETGRVERTRHSTWTSETMRVVDPTNLRHRFTHVGIDDQGRLALCSRKQVILSFTFSHARGHLTLEAQQSGVLIERRSFKKVSLPRAYGLSRASWEDGSEAFLDSRGLLHLRSSDKALPELSIVLHEGTVAGWSSNGTLWGDPYFTDQPAHSSALDAFTNIEEFVSQLR